MAHIPTLEEILSEVHSRLGLEALPNKNRFINCELELSSHVERTQSLLSDIFNTFLLDKRAREDLEDVILTLSGALKALELHTWTGNASQQQVLWATLVRVFIPISARHLAFWNLGNIELGLPPCDAGMPGGEFWFLPTTDFKSGTIDLPVPKVLNWLLDLLNCPSTEDLSNSIGNKQLRESEGGNEAAVRTLRNWQSGKLPKSQQKIEEIFPDDAQLVFAGAFQLDTTLTLETQFENAFKFATQHKKLDLEQLHKQIPMNPARLERVFNGTASDEEKSDFVRQICIRYAAPDMAVIRQRLQIARLFQAGYQDLLKFLCPEITPAVEHDPQKNKLLQLIYFFQEIYNKTTDALNHGDNNPDQDAWFLKQFHPFDQYDLLPFINTDIDGDGDGDDRVKFLAARFTRIFLSLDPEHGLENIYAKNIDDIKNSLLPRWKRIQQEFEEDKKTKILLERVKAASPYRTIQSESNFQVLIQFAQSSELNEKIRRMAYERLATIAKSPLERGSLTLLELGELLNGVQNTWPKDICAKVQKLLDSAEADKAVWELWKAPLLRFKATHALFQNQHAAAEKLFKAALEACSERAFGGLRGEIARAGFAVAIQRSGLNRKNHEPFYRNYLLYSEFENGIPSFEDAATECEEFYWSKLYRTYPDFKVEENISSATFKKIFIFIENSNWDGIKKWLTNNEKILRNHDFKDARRQSLLMLSIKFLFHLKDNPQYLLLYFPEGNHPEN